MRAPRAAIVPAHLHSALVKAAVAAILALQAALGLYLGLPGQMSWDSVVQLYEGRTLHFISWNPPLMSLLLGALDRLGNASVGFVLMSQALLSGATWLVFAQAGRLTWLRLLFATLVVLNPVLLIYVGILWKDVLLAHLVVFTYLLIARLRREERMLTLPLAVFLLLLLTAIEGVRQQGPLFALPAALWAATTARPSRRARLFAAIAFLAIPLAANGVIDAYVAQARTDPHIDPVSTGWRVLVQYDVAGILANGGALPADTTPALADEFRRQSLLYSPYRVDTLGAGPAFGATDGARASRLWRATIAANPGAYLRHRSGHFAAMLGLRDERQCLPIYTGVAGPVVHEGVDLSAMLGLPVGPTHASSRVFEFGQKWMNTPLFMHLAYAVVLVPLALWLVRRRDYVLATLAGCALVFLAAYAVIGVACDFRYGYTLTVATTLLAAHACLNLGTSRNAARS